MKEVFMYNDGHTLYMNHIISIGNVRTIFGHTPTSEIFEQKSANFSDIGRTPTDFLLKLTPLVRTLYDQMALS